MEQFCSFSAFLKYCSSIIVTVSSSGGAMKQPQGKSRHQGDREADACADSGSEPELGIVSVLGLKRVGGDGRRQLPCTLSDLGVLMANPFHWLEINEWEVQPVLLVVFLGILFLNIVKISPCETRFLLWFGIVRGVPGVSCAKASRLWMVQIKLSQESRNWFDQHPLMLKMRSRRNEASFFVSCAVGKVSKGMDYVNLIVFTTV